MKLTDYIDTPSVRVFQHFAGESLENLNEAEAWDVIVVTAIAASMASTIGEQGLRAKSILRDCSKTMDFTPNPIACIGSLDRFPLNQIDKFITGFVSIGFEVDSQIHPVVIAAIRMLQEVLGRRLERLDEADAWILIAVIGCAAAYPDEGFAVDLDQAKSSLRSTITMHLPVLKALDALKGLPKELAPQFIVTLLQFAA